MKLNNLILSGLLTIGFINSINATVLNDINNVDLKKLGINKLANYKNGFNYTKSQKDFINKLLVQLNKHEYLHQEIDLDLGIKFLNIFTEKLDKSKTIFLKEDIKAILTEYGTKETNPVTSKNLDYAYQIYYLYLIRKAETIQVKLKYLKSLNKEPNLNTSTKLYHKQSDYLALNNRNKVLKDIVLDDLINLKIDNITAYKKSKFKPLEKKDNTKKNNTPTDKIDPIKLKTFSQLKNELIKKYERELRKVESNDVNDAFTAYASSLANSGDYRTYWNGPKRDPNIYDGLMGISFNDENGLLKVLGVSGAAKETGKIKIGDTVLAVANKDPKNIKYYSDYPNVTKFIYETSGKAGETTYITLQRDSGKPFIVELVRKKRDEGYDLEDGEITITEYIGKNGKYLSFISENDFYFNYGKDVRKAIKNKGYKGVIIDLRNNGGGLIHSALELSSAFVPLGTVVTIGKYGNDKYANIENVHTKLPQVFDGALFLLQNSGSASASEMTAGWVQALKRGYILGGKSYGKGSIQNDASMGFDWYYNSLHRTIGKFYDPSGNGAQLNPYKPTIYFSQNVGNPYKDYEINNLNPAPGGSVKAYKWFKPFEQYVTSSITGQLIDKSNELKNTSKEYKAFTAYTNELQTLWKDYTLINFNSRIAHKEKLNKLYLERVNIQRKLEDKPLYKNFYEIPNNFDLKDIEREITFKLLDYYVGILESKNNK